MGFFKKKNNTKIKHHSTSSSQTMKKSSIKELKTNLQENIQIIRDSLGKSSDIIIRDIRIGKEETIKAGIIYTNRLTDTPSL